MLFECATGKDWKIVMYEVYDVVPGFAFPYFFFHYFLCVYILCNLFVAVIIDTFNSAGRELPCTPDHMEVFQNCTRTSRPRSLCAATHLCTARRLEGACDPRA